MSQVPYPPAGAQTGQAMHPDQQQPGYGSTPQQGYPPQQGYGPPAQQPGPSSLQGGHGPPQQQPGYEPPQQQPGYGPRPGQQQFPGGAPSQHQGYGPPPRQQQGYAPPVGQQVTYNAMQQADGTKPAFRQPQDEAQAPSYTGSDVPDQDVVVVDDDRNVRPPSPSAPPADMFDSYAGYENVRFGTAYLHPPPPYEPPPQPQTPEKNFPQATAISEDQARDMLLAIVPVNCCGKKAIDPEDMEIKDVTPFYAYHYTLKSFCESRSTVWKYDPYRGQHIDGPQNGPAPPPWSIPAQPTQLFTHYQKAHIEVPHAATVKPCHECMAMGYKRCYRCYGRGGVRCTLCHGSGYRMEHRRDGESYRVACICCTNSSGSRRGSSGSGRRSSNSRGSGRNICITCLGHGRVTCWTCHGQGQLKMYIELTVKWECHFDEHVTMRTILPDYLIVKSRGTDIFTQELSRVYPITTFRDPDANIGSRHLVDAHSRNWPSKRIVMQRQTLRAVPVSEVHYKWKETSKRFWVYGLDHEVYALCLQLQQCCCGCTIL